MPRCPYLGLEQEGTTPFPFPSSSHHCYTSAERLRIGQQEQERYCLTKRYSSCPLFIGQPSQEGIADKLPETVAEEEEPEFVVEPPLKATARTRSIREILADWFASAMARQRERKAAVEPLPGQEALADKLAEGVAEERTTRVVVDQPLNETAEPPIIQEMLADKLPEASTPEGKLEITGEQPPLKEALSIRPEVISMIFKVWPWIVAGMAFLTLLCMGGLITFRVLGTLPEISLPPLALPSLLPGTLLLVSVVSLAGALVLIGIFLWIRRVTTSR